MLYSNLTAYTSYTRYTTNNLYVFYNIMLDIGERATELMFPV